MAEAPERGLTPKQRVALARLRRGRRGTLIEVPGASRLDARPPEINRQTLRALERRGLVSFIPEELRVVQLG